MLTENETPSFEKPEPPAPPSPYVKPAVERIPLNDASGGTGAFAPDLQTFSS